MTSILFVCLGNICRSPAAEGVMRQMVKDSGMQGVHIESCGLGGGWPLGTPPDARMRAAAEKRGVILESGVQLMQPRFFEKFDLIFAADNKILNVLYQHVPTPELKAKIHLMTYFSKSFYNQEVPDPYFGEHGFDHVLDMLEDSCAGILEHLQSIHQPRSAHE